MSVSDKANQEVTLGASLKKVLRIVLLLGTGTLFAPAQQTPTPDVPRVGADAGPCYVNFTVSDSGGKPVYDAKISGQVRYGFGGFHKVDLQVGTNSDGKARIDGLPERTKKPIDFAIRHADASTSASVDTGANCHQDMDVKLPK